MALACADDDAQGEELEVFWDCEPDRRESSKAENVVERWGRAASTLPAALRRT